MRGRSRVFAGFGGGVNTQGAPYHLREKDPIEARRALNVVGTSRGAIRKRDGAQTFATPAEEIKSLFAGHAPDVLIAASASKLYRVATGGAVTQIKAGLADAPWEWVRAPANGGQGPFYGMNGVDPPQQYDGVGAAAGDWTATSGAVPTGKYLLWHGNRLWVAADDAVYWSDIGDPRVFPAANVTRLDSQDGMSITGLGTVGPYVVVFKSAKAFLITDLDRGGGRKLADVGCVAHRSIAATPVGTIFLTRDHGVMVTDGSGVYPLSESIRVTLDGLSPALRPRAAAEFWNGHYYLSIAAGGVANDLTLDYDTIQRSWWLHSLAANDWAVWEPAGAAGLYGGQPAAARVSKAFVPGETQDHGQPFAAYWAGPFHTFGDPARRKRIREIHFDGKGRIRASTTRDFMLAAELGAEARSAADAVLFGGAGLFAGDGAFGGEREVEEMVIPTPGIARAVSVEFGNDTAESFEVESYTVALSARRD